MKGVENMTYAAMIALVIILLLAYAVMSGLLKGSFDIQGDQSDFKVYCTKWARGNCTNDYRSQIDTELSGEKRETLTNLCNDIYGDGDRCRAVCEKNCIE